MKTRGGSYILRDIWIQHLELERTIDAKGNARTDVVRHWQTVEALKAAIPGSLGACVAPFAPWGQALAWRRACSMFPFHHHRQLILQPPPSPLGFCQGDLPAHLSYCHRKSGWQAWDRQTVQSRVPSALDLSLQPPRSVFRRKQRPSVFFEAITWLTLSAHSQVVRDPTFAHTKTPRLPLPSITSAYPVFAPYPFSTPATHTSLFSNNGLPSLASFTALSGNPSFHTHDR